MYAHRVAQLCALACLATACGGDPSSSSSTPVTSTATPPPASAPAPAGLPSPIVDPAQVLQGPLSGVAADIAASAAGIVRTVDEPLFDDFELGLSHAITGDRRMNVGPSRIRMLDLELLEAEPAPAVATLRSRLEAAGFTLNSQQSDGIHRDWDYRRQPNPRNLQGVLVKLSERPLRKDRAPEHAGATAVLSLNITDSRPQ